MSSYIYMKILESRPLRYDRGVAWLSLGQSEKIKTRIVNEHVGHSTRALEIGVGTGGLAMMMAKKGATVLGFDVSPGMLEVARAKIGQAGLEDRVELREMGVARMDKLEDESFDLVVSTLVFSELSNDEQVYALNQAMRVLKPGGKLALADEVLPANPAKRLLYYLLRLPLLVITFALTQTTTHAVRGLPKKAAKAGFKLARVERSRLDSFIYLVGVKE